MAKIDSAWDDLLHGCQQCPVEGTTHWQQESVTALQQYDNELDSELWGSQSVRQSFLCSLT
jgi:hypothetical protein